MIKRFRGDTFPMVWELSINNTPHDLTTATEIRFTYIKRDSTVVDIIGVVTDAINGTVKFSPTETTFDISGEYTFDVQVKYADGTRRTFVKDTIKIEDDVNKS